MTKLEISVNVAGAEQVAVEGLSFQHTNYLGLDQTMNWKHAALKVINSQGDLTKCVKQGSTIISMSDIRITNCEFSHTAMTGLFVSHVSNLVADRNVFTDIGNLASSKYYGFPSEYSSTPQATTGC